MMANPACCSKIMPCALNVYVVIVVLISKIQSLKNYDEITSNNKMNFILISYSCATNIENLSTNGLLK